MPLDPLVILKGDVKLGSAPTPTVSYKTDISSVEIMERRATVVIPATLDTGAEGKRAGVYSAQVTFNVIGDLQATSLYTLLRDAVRNATPLYMIANMRTGVTGPTNPAYSAALAITEARIGAASGSLSQFAVTVDVDGLVSTSTTP
jgi:hypothetical protein